MANKNSIQYTIKVALALCIVCSVVVSTAAVMLKPAQQANKARDFKSNILSSAGLLEEGKSIEEIFERVDTRIVDLASGTFSDAFDPEEFDQRKAASDPDVSENLTADEDLAKIGRKERYAEVYLATDPEGRDILILPVRGYGLWGTLYGFLALESDYNTIVGLTFYEHKETPGLGAEVDNPAWKAIWDGKEVYSEEGEVAITVLKGKVDNNTPDREHKVDGLSGATLTSRGVHNLLRFWMGENGYKPFLDNLRSGEA